MSLQLLSLMIDGDMPIDLRVARHCCQRLNRSASGQALAASSLVQAMEVLDAAILFAVPPGCLASLRSEAMAKLERFAGEGG